MENLKALVYGHDLNDYQRKLAQNEFEAIDKQVLSASSFEHSKLLTAFLEYIEEIRLDYLPCDRSEIVDDYFEYIKK